MTALALLAIAAASAFPEPADLTIAASAEAAFRDAALLDAGEPSTGETPWWTEDDWTWVDRSGKGAGASGRKSGWAAVGSSLLLPGLGERYVGHGNRAKLFFAAEAAIWSTFATYRIQGATRRGRFIEFAETKAGAPGKGDGDYYEHIGFWQSLEEWHDIVRRDARAVFPDDPAAQEDYFEKNKRFDEGDYWAWPDDDTRLRYRVLRSKSERAFRNARLAIGAALLNRFASMVDAFALSRKFNRGLESEGARLELRLVPENTADGLVLGPVLTAEF